jgi:hypothetical protein
MSIVDRVKNICLSPKTEWPVIATEETPTGELITGYVAPLAAVSAIAAFIGGSLVGRTLPFVGTVRVPIVAGLGAAIFSFAMMIVGVLVLGWIINALAPTFGGQKSSNQALKVAVYSATPAWVAGALQVLPVLGLLGILASLYALYLLYLGLPRLMKAPEDKAIGYTVVVVLCAIVFAFVVGGIGATITGAGMLGSMALGGGLTGDSASSGSAASDVQVDPDSPLGRLQELGQKLDESTRRMEAAQQSGDAGAQVAAAMEGLGAIFGGGNRVEPLDIDRLRPFAPNTFAGLPRTSSNAEKSGMAGLMVSRVEAVYGDGADRTVTLEISDTGGISGVMALAGWMGIQGEKEDESGIERTQKVGGRIVHEKISKTGGTNEYAIVLGDRFVVSARGDGIGQPELRTAVSGLNLAGLEALRAEGIQR